MDFFAVGTQVENDGLNNVTVNVQYGRIASAVLGRDGLLYGSMYRLTCKGNLRIPLLLFVTDATGSNEGGME